MWMNWCAPLRPDAGIDEERCLVAVRDLAVGHGRAPVASGISLDVLRGDWWWLLGENGSGKTTLLQTLLGRLAPLGGRLWRHPAVVDGSILGVVPQRDELAPTLPLTVLELVRLGQVGLGRPARECRQLAEQALTAVGLDGHRSYWRLSGGQRQRALLARALAREPRLLVLDEPFNHLDTESRERLLAALDACHGAGCAIVVVGHDPALVLAHPGQVLTLAPRSS